MPFFDPASVLSHELPSRWSRLWKLHGSLGWKISDNAVIRTGARDATELIYPDHLKYDQVTRLPYSALFERLRQFLTTPDTLLICSGFSFLDSHICAVLDEALAANAHTAILAFQYKSLDEERLATQLAFSRPNMSVYARDGAVINGVQGDWRPGPPPSEDWRELCRTFWGKASGDGPEQFLLGDFARLARFLALTQAQFPIPESDQEEDSEQLGDGSDSEDRSRCLAVTPRFSARCPGFRGGAHRSSRPVGCFRSVDHTWANLQSWAGWQLCQGATGLPRPLRCCI